MVKSLRSLRTTIKQETPNVGRKQYSHNIIGLALQQIAKEYGHSEANKAIDDFKLETLGWSKVTQ